jgi:hypothetical protein
VHGRDVCEGADDRAIEQNRDEDRAECADEYVIESHVASFAGRVHTACVAVSDGRQHRPRRLEQQTESLKLA